ncbi:MAG: hypothetical protein DRN15_11420 [Thermoprotei archaeon]|nr:MAG: hypothetical protein DRN15_11420 [Thermoprotei archaeon]
MSKYTYIRVEKKVAERLEQLKFLYGCNSYNEVLSKLLNDIGVVEDLKRIANDPFQLSSVQEAALDALGEMAENGNIYALKALIEVAKNKRDVSYIQKKALSLVKKSLDVLYAKYGLAQVKDSSG